ncbi:hypothetical protein GUITHDRAFT_161312 [Guillardia theta CCMP2712]|uniref:Uncharacterized protein n=2 Tax=Guillardia theta TaxID=55529 RepID=L1JUM3_GUITC|nr:hypothetical protein GUITHDRAFT_161312 [Guillardia theta CCMP2712]EKX52117.1 hypothetical protein GUITHDRAFT_161312 [Guillardia theta CCMP2712]|eukprot:XP_005839097.1 hypothetical protein GUITHDRAFT_161312 [Guillardia theta CCMP2712]
MSYMPPTPLTMNDDPIVKESGFTISGISNEQGEGWQVVGDDIQALLAVLQQGQEVMCQPGAMVSTTGTVEPELTTGGCFNGCKRCWCAGELCCRTHYKNVNGRLEHVTVSPPYPSKIIPVSMNEHTSGLYITRQSWLASVGRDADFNVSCMPSFSQCCCLGLGCCIPSLVGSGYSFLAGGGTVMKKTLREGESVVVQTTALLAWDKKVKLEGACAGGPGVVCCGGMGFCTAKFTGPGTIYVQSMSFSKWAMSYMRP